MSGPVKLGIVGAGAIAQSYVQALRNSDLARIVAVADLRSEAARALAEGADCAAFESHKRQSEGESGQEESRDPVCPG